MLFNLWLAYRVFARLGGSGEIGAIAALLWAFHGKFDYLYYNGGSLYDVFCFLFVLLRAADLLAGAVRGPIPGRLGNPWVLVCLVCALKSKEMARDAAGDRFLIYELICHPPDLREAFAASCAGCLAEGRDALLGAIVHFDLSSGQAGLKRDRAERSICSRFTRWARWLRGHRDFPGLHAVSQQSGLPT